MIGKTLGHYRVGEQLGRGGMGEVYAAEDLNLDRKVALKFLPDVFTGDHKAFPFLRSAHIIASGQYSPDGRWVAYSSNESGRYDVYVVPFPAAAGKWQISTGGGGLPRWRRDGNEIFYIAPDGVLMAASVNGKGTGFEVDAVKPLFQARPASTSSGYFYDVTADGQHFLINTASGQSPSAQITVIVNWTALLKK